MSDTKDKEERKRRVVNKDSLKEDGEVIMKKIEEEVDILRKSNEKVKGTKFLRSIGKMLKKLMKDVDKVTREKKEKNVEKSGLYQLYILSDKMNEFTEDSNPKSRIDVTKFICDYIKKNNLQHRHDKRIIVPDKKLIKLLGVDKEITYMSLQSLLSVHFIERCGSMESKENVDEK